MHRSRHKLQANSVSFFALSSCVGGWLLADAAGSMICQGNWQRKNGAKGMQYK